MSRTQHIIPSGVIAVIGLWVAYISFTQQPADAFLFPRLISTVFAALALVTFAKAVLGKARTGEGLSLATLRKITPGLIIALVYVFWAAKALGFYTASCVAVFTLISLYDPAPHSAPKSWGARLIITAVFMAVMYLLFAVLLKVYTPPEILL